MKKVIGAAFVRLLEFDSLEEVDHYLKQLNEKHKRYEIENRCKLENGKFRLLIREQYNNNEMI